MKGMKSIIILILLMAMAALGTNTASAAVNVFLNATMPYDVLYQGQIVSANVTIKNNENFPIRVYSVGVHYDWMPENVFSAVDFGGGYRQVESNGLTTPGQLLIQCDSNVTTGYHTFFYRIELNWYNAYTAAWVNETVMQPGTIYVESPMKPQALQELQFANKTLSDARSTSFVSKRAVDSMQKASDSLSDGWSAYNLNDFPRAINDSRDTVNSVSDAKIAEKNYRENATDIERIVASVTDKLKTVGATADPDTKKSIQEANEYLNRTRQNIDSEDFVSALTYANKADHSADTAIQDQFYYLLKANETEAAKSRAQSALDTAQANLDNASNMTSPTAAGILSDAMIKMGDATVLFSREEYANATIKANVVSTLVTQANSDEASYRMMLARNKIASLGDLISPEAKSRLANASSKYNQSESDFIASRYKDAADNASAALKDAQEAQAIDQKYRADNPLSAVTPGFEALAALLTLGAIFIMKQRKG